MTDYTLVPHEELQSRWARLQDLLSASPMDGALFYQNADLLYLCGTTQVEAVFVPQEGEVLILARPPLDRAVAEMPWTRLVPMPRSDSLKKTLAHQAGGRLNVLGLELDVLPVNLYRRLASTSLAGLEIMDASPLIRQIRAIKSDYEIIQLKKAAQQAEAMYQIIPSLLAQGVTELELETGITSLARNRGHQGVIRFRGFNNEIFYGHVLSGTNGLLQAKVSSPTGGAGVGPGLGHGASLKTIGPNELVSVDVCAAYGAYIVDQTRLYFTGPIPTLISNTYQSLLQLTVDLAAFIKPGVTGGQIYQKAFDLAEKYGLAHGFMGLGKNRCPFVGHGLGIELDELPILARGVESTLAPGMTFALEPRVFLPDIGVIGLEDTYHLTENGTSFITFTDRGFLEVALN